MSQVIPAEAVEAAVRAMRARPDVIVIDSGAGSLLPPNPNRDKEATRRGLVAIRVTANERRQKSEPTP